MSQINFKNQIIIILSKQIDFEKKMDVIIKDLTKYLASREKAIKLNDKPSQKKTKKRLNSFAKNFNYCNLYNHLFMF
jgi:hypothetical protein